MANTLTDLLPKILADAVVVLREQSIMPRLVRNYSDSVAASPGDTINIRKRGKVGTQAVSAGAGPTAAVDVTRNTTPLILDDWRQSEPFALTDKELGQVGQGIVNSVISESAQALAEYVDAKILDLYKKIYNFSMSRLIGVPQETAVPAAFVTEATNNPNGLRAFKEARAWLNREGAPMGDRRVVLGVDDEGDALTLSQFLKADERGDQGGILAGIIGQKLGAQWFMDQAVKVHTSGTIADDTAEPTAGATEPVGETSILLNHATASVDTVLAGDILKFANHDQTYVVVTGATFNGGTPATATIVVDPPLKVEVPSTTVVVFVPSHTANLVFHPDAFGFASRPLASLGSGNYAQIVDPISGLALRVEVERQSKRDLFTLDILFGVAAVEPRLAARLGSAK